MNAPLVRPGQVEPRAMDVVPLARRYCELIETSGPDNPSWLRLVSMLLPKLHAAMTSLAPATAAAHSSPADLDARFDLFSRLRGLLAERDGYYLEFDFAQDEGIDAMTGSLADDLTDIYCELKTGLRAYETDPAQAFDAWATGYDCHWGQHLVDAGRHLAVLAAANRLD